MSGDERARQALLSEPLAPRQGPPPQLPLSAAVDPPTVAAALRRARSLGVDRLDAQLLLARALGRPRTWLLAHDDEVPTADQAARFDADLARRADGVPLAYLLGEKEFRGLLLCVTPDVLVPRPDTETLADWAVEALAALDATAGGGAVGAGTGRREPLRIVDLGTGSGAVALALAQTCAEAGRAAAVCAVDVSAAALEVARDNARRLGLAVEWLRGDWWSALPGRRFDLAVSNPPYVAEGDPHLAALRHEPALALASGADGLDALRTLIGGAGGHLAPGGRLLVEHGHGQAAAVRALLRDAGFAGIETRRDLAGNARCSGGRGPAAAGTPATD